MVLIELNGQERILRYDVNSICALEEKMKRGLYQLLSEENMGFSFVRGFLWAGLLHENRGLTFDMVGIWLHTAMKSKKLDFEIIIEKIMAALKEAGILGMSDDEDDSQESKGETNLVTKS